MCVICVRTGSLFLFALLLYSGSHAESTESLYKCMNPDTGELVNSNVKDMKKININMPGAKPEVDQYICTSIRLPPETNYVVQFEASASASAAHHILLFGCASPLQVGGKCIKIAFVDLLFSGFQMPDIQWSCGSICERGSPSVLFAWAKNAESTVLPCDVAFRIGKSSNITSLVMQVHYAVKHESNQPLDHSGLTLYITKEEQKYSAGIFLLDSYSGVIPANKPASSIDMSCKFTIPGSIYPFAYRTHAHSLGIVISGYKFNGTWTLIGKGNPQWPQAFYPVKKIIEIKKNDVVVGRCTYNSTGRNRKTIMGPKHTDEMCNFYMMYYSDNSKKISNYMECMDDDLPRVSQRMPADSAKPLPPNPLLEAKASMTNMHHPHTGSTVAPSSTSNGNPHKEIQKQGRLFAEQKTHDSPYNSPSSNNKGPLNLLDYDYNASDQYKRFYHEFDSFKNAKLYGYPRYQLQGSQHQTIRNRNRNKAFQALNEQLSSQLQSDTHHLWRNRGYLQGFGVSSSRLKNNIQFAASTSTSVASTSTSVAMTTKTAAVFSTTIGTQMGMPQASRDYSIQMIYDPSWPDKNAVTLGCVGGVAVDPSGNVHVFHRGPRIWNMQSFNSSNIFQDQDKPITVPTVVVFDRKGKLVKQWGANMFFMPHGITVDHNGSVWITDVALHQVFRFPAGETKPDLELGERFRPGNDNQHFCKPADVAIMSDGQFFVADGYCNTRVIKFSKDGTFLKKWGYSDGAVGADGFPGPGVFFVVHSVTVAEDKGLVCASDRENGRIQCFDLNGNFRQQIHPKEFGYELYALDYCPQHGGVLFAVNGPQNQTKKPCKVFMINIHSGNLISSWPCPKGMDFPHDISVDSINHSVYVGDLLARAAWKLQMVSANLTGKFSKKNEIGQPNDGRPNSELEENPNKADFQVSVLIGSLLIAPMFLIIIIAVVVRYCNSGKFKCCDRQGGSLIGRQHKSFFGNLLTDRHKGFNPVNTEDSDHEIDPLTLSDDEEDYYRIPSKSRT